MDTHGHEECAKDAGKPLIADALARVGRDFWRLEALYLGNWLTDVSQIVDPVAIGNFRSGIEPVMYRVLDGARALLQQLPEAVRYVTPVQSVIDAITFVRTQIPKALDHFTSGGQGSPLSRGCADAFFVLGYKKFVHPETRGNSTQPAKMSYPGYEQIFNRPRFTQYFPHEHLDRYPQKLVTPSHRDYSSHLARGTWTADGHGTGASRLTPHIYSFLKDDLKIAAGLLADVDFNWARLTFRQASVWSSDENPDWNEWLAKLGHALHALEDFFTHSNFIELALKGMPDGARYLPRHSEGIVRDSPWEIVEKRLRRYNGTPCTHESEWRALAPESEIVSGYFDFTDTFFSVRHVYEDLFGKDFDWSEEEQRADEHEAWRKLLRNTVAGVQRRTAHLPQLSEAEARRIAQEVLVEQATRGDPDERAAANDLISEVPPRVKDRFLSAVAVFAARPPGGAISLYDAWEFLYRLKRPIRLILKYVTGLPPQVLDALMGWWEDRLKDVIDRELGHYRVGSHSLMAHDYAWHVPDLEKVDEIFNLAKAVAKSVHSYVVKTLTRWSRQQTLNVCRADCDAQNETALNRIGNVEAIDWLELVEFFCRHPHSQPAAGGLRWWEPVVRHGWEAFPEDAHVPLYLPSWAPVQQLYEEAATLRGERERAYIPEDTPAAGAAQPAGRP